METAYFKKKLYGGKNAFSRIADAVFFRAFIFCAIFLMLPAGELRLPLALLLLTAACIALKILADFRLARFRTREREEIEKKLKRQRLLLMPEDELRAELGMDFAIIRRSKEVGIDELLPIIRGDYKICCSVSPFSKEAQDFCAAVKPELELRDMLSVFSPEITREDMEAYIRAQVALGAKRIRFKGFRLERVAASKYLVLGFMLLLLSFFVRYTIYYRLLATLSFVLPLFFRLRTLQRPAG
ncbi:MAG: hypothetical protein Q4C04_04600 [Clostridia bacterium]|nr:hypothetical protein [Clostridia bacterium]